MDCDDAVLVRAAELKALVEKTRILIAQSRELLDRANACVERYPIAAGPYCPWPRLDRGQTGGY